MQFMPATWKAYGVDGNQDGLMDPYNPVDAIFAAARYLKAAGADKDIRGAVFAYNHADWYVDSVLLRAQVIGGLPTNLVGSLTGLTEGRFPVAAKATYADEVTQAQPEGQAAPTRAVPVERRQPPRASRSTPTPARRSSRSATRSVTKIGVSKRLGHFVQVQDAYGNTYTYGRLAKISKLYAAPKPQKVDPAEVKRMLARRRSRQDAQGRRVGHRPPRLARDAQAGRRAGDQAGRAGDRGADAAPSRRSRSACSRTRRASNAAAAGGAQQEFLRTGRIDGALTPARALGLARDQIVIKKLKVGSQVPAGTVLGRIGTRLLGQAPARALRDPPGRPRRPADRPEADPRRLEAARVDRDLPRQGQEPVRRPRRRDADDRPDPADEQGDADPARARRPARSRSTTAAASDIQAGAIDRRVLATLEFLVASGFNPTITSLHCGHSYLTASGNVSEHSTGTAVDIAAINGIPILGNQGKGSITDLVIQRLLTLQGTMKPHQIISLMKFDGRRQHARRWPTTTTTSTSASRPQYGTNSEALQAAQRGAQARASGTA